ncbi:hypothetical protein ID866_6154 [Astraeus odoratus]|nr:hypothetical protein ID866_6154 [Astraeus odoratus]
MALNLSTMQERPPYEGAARKLVLAFDVGTTYSGISYSILDPGEPPVICDVTRFPSTEHVGGNSKIPTIIYYDNDGIARAFGGEALQEAIIEKADEEEWVKAEWWKLHLRPKNMSSIHVRDEDIPLLPPLKTAVELLADFMKYLFQCVRTYIEESHANGRDMWQSFESDIDFVLSHPNGWEGAQQAQIRRAAVMAGLVPDTPEGQARIRLVTEGEASLHYCLGCKHTADAFKGDVGVMIIDAGGGTIDISSYYMTSSPPTIREIAPTECRLQGSIFITQRAEEHLEQKLLGSKFGSKEDIKQMKNEFDKTTKLRFSNPEEPSYIRFGTVRDKDPAFNIRSGQLKLPGSEVATLFEPSAEAIIAAVEDQRKAAAEPITGTTISETKEFRKDYIVECAERTTCDTVATEIVCYRGDSLNPQWADLEPAMFSNLCTVHADTSKVSKTLSPRRGFAGMQYYRQQFGIILKFGLTELEAQISWKEDDEEKRGPATVVFDHVVEAI